MKQIFKDIFAVICVLLTLNCVAADERFYPLNSLDGIKQNTHANVSIVEYKGNPGLRVTRFGDSRTGEAILIQLAEASFITGTIELEIAGDVSVGAHPNDRGFVGLAFHVDPENSKSFSLFRLRPTNGRARDQLRRNHTVAYTAHPDYPWYVMRRKFPGVYESYADLVPGEWTKMKIVVTEDYTELYLHDFDQPCMVVNDLKRAGGSDGVGLWLWDTTLAHFRNVRISEE